RIRSLGPGEAVLASFRDVVSEIRAAGKDVIAYLPNGADNRALFLASAARLVLVGPETTVAPVGYAAVGRYLRRALAHAGIEPEIFARGTYKSAGEALVRDGMSDAEREQVSAIVAARYDALVAALAQGRRVDRATAAGWIDAAPHTSREAVKLGLVDGTAYEDELEGKIARPLKLVAAARYLKRRSSGRLRPLRPRRVLGVVEVHGPIVSRARIDIGGLASEDRVVASLRAARADRRVAGVVLHVDSPGGSAVASDRIHREVRRLAEVKPVVAYLSNVAASGGYYVAAGAHAIVAQPQTITGSIGVVAARFVVGPLLQRLGVNVDVVKRGAHADMFDVTRHFDGEERAQFERELDAFYERFLAVVAEGRRREVDAIRPLAEGRVYAGGDAHDRRLVDLLGGFDRAVHELRVLVGPEARGLEPRIVRARRKIPPPAMPATAPGPAVMAALRALAPAAGLDRLPDALLLALHLEGERALLYYPGV
ncbi:MAG TPA: signal peptide peptidase SppA, partial [Minicystis sp.]|nr:signal peptide peptidase SppA [Minicystis sp.]